MPIILLYVGYYVIFISLLRQVNIYCNISLRIIFRFKPKILLAEKLNYLGVQNLEDPQINNLITRSTENIGKLESVLEVTSTLIGISLTLIASAIIVFNFSWVIGLLTFILVIPRIIFNSKFLKKEWDLEKETTIQKRIADGNLGYITKSSTLKEVTILNAYDFLKKYYDEFSNYFIKASIDIRKDWAIFLYVYRLSDIFIFVLTIYNLAEMLVAKAISIGQVSLVLNNVWVFSNSLSGIINTYTNLNESTIRLKEFKELLDKERDSKDGNITLDAYNNDLNIQFKDIGFHYPNSKKMVLKDFNFNVKSGEKIAIVGHNGAGKTTFIKLLTKIYRPSAGSININGQDLNDISTSSWYSKLGVLFQDYNTYEHLTVRENIILGSQKSDTGDKKIWEALKLADAEEFIKEYPLGLDTILSERYNKGIRPSTGQWQKIAIARFFYRDAPILILDEPTSAIDAVAEANIFDRIYRFVENKTVIIISHRFSTVRNADRIIVFEHGKILEDGSHEELLTKKGTYYNAFNIQAKGYAVEEVA